MNFKMRKVFKYVVTRNNLNDPYHITWIENGTWLALTTTSKAEVMTIIERVAPDCIF